MRNLSLREANRIGITVFFFVVLVFIGLYFIFVFPKANSNTAAELSAKGELTYHANGCDIKAPNLSASLKEYYVPGQPSYDNLNMSAVLGGRWFCSEQDAIRNGWTKAKP